MWFFMSLGCYLEMDPHATVPSHSNLWREGGREGWGGGGYSHWRKGCVCVGGVKFSWGRRAREERRVCSWKRQR